MKSKERILAALRGAETDRCCWSPNPAYWWEAQADSLVQGGEYEFLAGIGADPVFRGHYPMIGKYWENAELFRLRYHRCTLSEKTSGLSRQVTYETPVGLLQFEYRYSPAGDTWFLQKHGVNTEEDFKTLVFLMEDTLLEPDFRRFEAEATKLGDQGLVLAQLSPFYKTAFQSLLEFWVGTEELVYALADYPKTVEEALAAMQRVNGDAARIGAASSAEAFITFEDTSTTNVSPFYYEQYILPEITNWCELLHSSGKLYIQHACGHLAALLPLMGSAGIDCIESISPPPTGNIELWDARKLLPERVALVGGIEPTVFLNYEPGQLEEYVRHLLQAMKGTRFLLANSDSCPPGVSLEKLTQMAQLVREGI